MAGDLFVDADEAVPLGQRQALCAGGQPGDRLVVAQRVHGERPGLDLAVETQTRGIPHRLHTKLRTEEVGEQSPRHVGPTRVGLGHLIEQPPPTLAVGLGLFPALRQDVQDRLFVLVDRGATRLVVIDRDAVVGESRQIGQVLQTPSAPPGGEIAGEFSVEGEQGVGILFAGGVLRGLLHQLQRADSVALARVHSPPAGAAAHKLVVDDRPAVVHVAVRCGGRPQNAPVGRMGRDDLFDQGVPFSDPVQAPQAVHRRVCIFRRSRAAVGRVGDQFLVQHQRFVVVAFGLQFGRGRTVGRHGVFTGDSLHFAKGVGEHHDAGQNADSRQVAGGGSGFHVGFLFLFLWFCGVLGRFGQHDVTRSKSADVAGRRFDLKTRIDRLIVIAGDVDFALRQSE